MASHPRKFIVQPTDDDLKKFPEEIVIFNALKPNNQKVQRFNYPRKNLNENLAKRNQNAIKAQELRTSRYAKSVTNTRVNSPGRIFNNKPNTVSIPVRQVKSKYN